MTKITKFKDMKRQEYKPLKPAKGCKIHPAALVSCPRFSFDITSAAIMCPTCPHWRGLAMMNEAGEASGLPWHEIYAIRCAYPMERRAVIIRGMEDAE